ncbi:hypothetical protein bcgnr5369_68520 [Bacillus cereus]
MLEPNPTQIKEERIYAEMGLTDEEFAMVEKILGRLPNYTETGKFYVKVLLQQLSVDLTLGNHRY